MASRKQIAAAKRNIKKAQAAVRAKARKAGSRVKKRVKRAASSTKRRVTRRKTPNKTPKRRNTTKRSNNGMVFGKKIPIISNPIVKKIFIAAGAVSIIVSVLGLISPRAAAAANSTVGRGVIGLATGDVVGAVSNVAIPLIRGGGLGNLLGGNGNGGNSSNGGNNGGFA